MKKKDKIKEAYGKYWEDVKDYVDENGYCDKKDLFQRKNIRYEEIDLEFTHHTDFTMIPRLLEGIETNNGWIKIESENDLPKEINKQYFLVMKLDNSIQIGFYSGEFHNAQWMGGVSHYQPIEKPKPPIY